MHLVESDVTLRDIHHAALFVLVILLFSGIDTSPLGGRICPILWRMDPDAAIVPRGVAPVAEYGEVVQILPFFRGLGLGH